MIESDEERPTKQYEQPWPVTLVIGVLVFWALIHAGKTRSLDDFFRYPNYFAVPATACTYVFILLEWWRKGFRRPAGEELGLVATVPFGAYLIGAFYYALGASLKDIYGWLQSPSLSTSTAIVVTVCITFGLGLLLFYFRLRARSIYGLTEAFIGLAVAGFRVANELQKPGADASFYLALLTAGVYLVVRGLDNVHQGLTKDPGDPIALQVVAYVRGAIAKGDTAPTAH